MRTNLDFIYEKLTWREQEILHLLGEELSNDEIAARLSFSVNSVKWYNQQIFAKLGVNNRRQAAVRARELKLAEFNGVKSSVEPQFTASLQEPLENKPRNNLPHRLTSFIGREREKEQVKALLAKAALVTLTGSGGIGKTRLALEVAGELLEEFPDGVWFVELARLEDRTYLARAVFTALGLQENASTNPLEQLRDYLVGKELLLVFDNCEHLIEDCARIMEGILLRDCSTVRIIATSREVLGIPGERIYRVPSLSTPDPLGLSALDEPNQFEALRLFAERAGSIQPGFTLHPDNVSLVAQICRRVDGIPLAIELAAARVSILSVDQIAARLNDRFRLLTGGSRSALPRQQTLRASIDWSYSMLNEEERLLLTRLAIFSGGWTLEDAEAVCGFSGLDAKLILDILDSLVKKSMVVAQIELNPHPGVLPRYWLLETIRQYALDKLIDRDGGTELRRRHLSAFLHLAEQADTHLRGPHQLQWYARLEVELDNLRSALEWAMEDQAPGSAEDGLRLVCILQNLWLKNGLAVEGLDWLEKSLVGCSQNPPLSPVLQAWARRTAGEFYFALSRYSEAHQAFQESLSLYQTLEDPRGLIMAYYGLAATLDWDDHDDDPGSLEVIEEGLSLSRQVGDEWGQAMMLACKGSCCSLIDSTSQTARLCLEESAALFEKIGDRMALIEPIRMLGGLAYRGGDYELARFYLGKSLVAGREMRSKKDLVWTLSFLGDLAHLERQYPLMETYFQESQVVSQEIGYYLGTVWSLHHIGVAARHQGQLVRAEKLFRESHSLAHKRNCSMMFGEILIGMAGIAMDTGRLEQSVRLFAAVDSIVAHDFKRLPISSEEYRWDLLALRDSLEADKFQTAWAEGQLMTMEQALAYAFEAS